MSASKCDKNVDFVSFAASLSLPIAFSAVATVLSVVDCVLVKADVWLRCCWFFLSSSLKNDEGGGDDDCMVISFWSLPLTTKNDTDTILILLGTDVSFSAITFL